jgi:hypothetical protein
MAKDKFFKRLFSGIGTFFRDLFGRARKVAEEVIPVGIEVVENIKVVMDSPVPTLLTMLIPGQVDDVIAAKIKELLPTILLNLKIADECAKKQSNDEIIQCAIAHLRNYHPNAQKAYFLNIASMLSAALADGKLTWAEIVMITQYTYENRYNK